MMKCEAAQRSWQSCNLRLTCSTASLTDLHAAAARALFKPGGHAAMPTIAIPQLDHSLGPRRCVIKWLFGIPVPNIMPRSDRDGFSDLLSIAPQ